MDRLESGRICPVKDGIRDDVSRGELNACLTKDLR